MFFRKTNRKIIVSVGIFVYNRSIRCCVRESDKEEDTNVKRRDEGYMKSIQTKFIVLIVSGLSTMALLIAGFGIWSVSKVTKEDSQDILEETCTGQTLRLDGQLKMVEQAVTTIYAYAKRELNTEKLVQDKTYMSDYTEDVRVLATDISNRTEGAISVYFRYNPDVTGGGKDGFFWSKNSVDGKLERQEPTDLFAYQSSDMAHVGWYYIPVQAGEAIWMEPYYNENLDVKMISYVIPFYQEGRLIGIIGMDVDFSVFVDIAQDIQLYNTGKAELVCMKNRTLYYSSSDNDKTAVESVELSEKLYRELSNKDHNTSLGKYVFGGQDYRLAFQTLSNQMKVLVYAPVDEINAQRNRLILGCGIVMVLIFGLIIFVAVYITGRIVQPLRQLTDATERFAKGDWDISIRCYTRDEVKRLTDSITKMAEVTKSYIQEINKMAYQDGLTRVKNKACYIDYIEKLAAEEKEGDLKYAVVVFDVNSLKWVNDTYGHEEGDRLIIAASRKIGDIFSNSPIFRLGGDEFAVIMSGQDYPLRETLLQQFQNDTENCIFDEKKGIELSVASGMAVYPEDGVDYESVFRRADERMYQEKKKMKRGKSSLS